MDEGKVGSGCKGCTSGCLSGLEKHYMSALPPDLLLLHLACCRICATATLRAISMQAALRDIPDGDAVSLSLTDSEDA